MAGNSPDDNSSDREHMSLDELGDSKLIDIAIFEQILEMDDDDDEREFSKSIVTGFFSQAEDTFVDMDAKILERDLAKLSDLGHFLKGSSATLGLIKIKDSCAKIQHFGQHKDENGNHASGDDDKFLALIKATLEEVKEEYAEVKTLLKKFFAL